MYCLGGITVNGDRFADRNYADNIKFPVSNMMNLPCQNNLSLFAMKMGLHQRPASKALVRHNRSPMFTSKARTSSQLTVSAIAAVFTLCRTPRKKRTLHFVSIEYWCIIYELTITGLCRYIEITEGAGLPQNQQHPHLGCGRIRVFDVWHMTQPLMHLGTSILAQCDSPQQRHHCFCTKSPVRLAIFMILTMILNIRTLSLVNLSSFIETLYSTLVNWTTNEFLTCLRQVSVSCFIEWISVSWLLFFFHEALTKLEVGNIYHICWKQWIITYNHDPHVYA